ncbi:MAG TPA: DNA polymerase III subunit delta' [Burkholderiales bacterium]|jgi:DNA polymerase III subunit delta'|nr:DNA polymerase III subunit delta' [Burkholderiales bacterium]
MHPWNQPILDSLKSRLDRLPHAILLHGPRGVGKLELAEAMAQLLLCEHKDLKARPCGQCDGCRWYLAGNHPDFRRLEPEAIAKVPPQADEEEGSEPAPAKRTKQPSLFILIEQVRELAAFLNLRSHRGALRVALVHPAEDLYPNAANALLKGLEEPPAGAVFILVSHRPSRLLPTVRSRCVAMPVPIPPREAALAWLRTQKVENADRWLAFAGGAPLQALEYAGEASDWDRLLKSPQPVDDRESLERLAEALQKMAYDRAFSAFGLPPKYRTGVPAARSARAWLGFARRMGEDRMLTRHPLNPRLFSSELLGSMRDLT